MTLSQRSHIIDGSISFVDEQTKRSIAFIGRSVVVVSVRVYPAGPQHEHPSCAPLVDCSYVSREMSSANISNFPRRRLLQKAKSFYLWR